MVLEGILHGSRALLALLDNRVDEALSHASEGLASLDPTSLTSLPARRLWTWLLFLEAESLFRQGRMEEAREEYAASLDSLEALLQDVDRTRRSLLRREQTLLLLRLASTALADGFPAEGVPYLREALRLARQISRRDPENGILLRIQVLDLRSRVERENGELRRSLRHLREALPLLDHIRDRRERRMWEGHLRHREGLILLALGNVQEAADAARKAVLARRYLTRSRPAPHRRELAQSLLLFALALQELGQTREALRALNRSIRIFRERWTREGTPEAAMDLAAALVERVELLAGEKTWNSALRDTARALKLLAPLSPETTDTLDDWVHAAHLRAEIYFEKGDLSRAQKVFEQTLRTLERMGHTRTPFFEDLARAYVRFLRKTRRKPARDMEHLLSPRFPFPRS